MFFYNFTGVEGLKLPEDDAGASKQVEVLTIYEILLIYILCVCWSG
jgi:hypothetical protein